MPPSEPADFAAKWDALPTPARHVYLEYVVGRHYHLAEPFNASKFLPPVSTALAAAGFLTLLPFGERERYVRGEVPAAARPFVARLQAVTRLRIPAEEPRIDLYGYSFDSVATLFYGVAGGQHLRSNYEAVLKRNKVESSPGTSASDYVFSGVWPGWVYDLLQSPQAKDDRAPHAHAVWRAVFDALPPVFLADVPGLVPGVPPGEAARTVRLLCDHLALFEQLDAASGRLTVVVAERTRRAVLREAGRAGRPRLEPAGPPAEFGPEGGFAVADLRAFLLELAAAPARMKLDGGLYQREADRFAAQFPALPEWLTDFTGWRPAVRLDEAFAAAVGMKLALDKTAKSERTLTLSQTGQRWLAAGLSEQVDTAYEYRRRDAGDGWTGADSFFTGSHVGVILPAGGKKAAGGYRSQPADRARVRAALHRAFAALKDGAYYPAGQFVRHAADREAALLACGERPEVVRVLDYGREVGRLPERVEAAARSLLTALVTGRLVPYGALRVASGADGEVLVGRSAWLDRYFDPNADVPDEPQAAAGAARVVVQPDFSVVVIGMDPGPAAALAPFCERPAGPNNPGALVLKLTRASVVKAAAAGMTARQMCERLEKHASGAVPANVLTEVGRWCDWVRPVEVRALTVLRVGDRDTAERVLAVLGKKGERLSDTLVAFTGEKLTAAELTKLRQNGLVPGGAVPKGRKGRPA